MKTYRIRMAGWVLILGLVFGCNTVKNANNKQKGAVIGASSGAVIGGVVGNNVGKGNTVLGAIIGGVVGGVAGGYIGDRMDRQAEKIEEELPGAEVKRVGEGINVTFTQDQGVHFATNQSAIEGASVTTLNKLAGIFKEYPKSVILVEGHTDSAGPEDYNMSLSQRRAESVVNYLVAQGIDKDRFTVRWYGETQPRADNSTAEGKAQNRRVEMGIIASEALKEEARKETGGN
ncbi:MULTISPECIES: OmpA family protein [Robiginitalea]|uniref:OmpA family protein n=1 Tax=Robiginitalea TaxID=252306 RepID=UPI00234AE979|nr:MULTISPECIES: OmpA family protein [unclassified Robiginitalea]MDC6354022.1 OmpA family protein [Robiginitalea sp. PM2]MDC6374289.1 OmpA family protein [Robiginitalea sp. SP8]